MTDVLAIVPVADHSTYTVELGRFRVYRLATNRLDIGDDIWDEWSRLLEALDSLEDNRPAQSAVQFRIAELAARIEFQINKTLGPDETVTLRYSTHGESHYATLYFHPKRDYQREATL